VRYDGVTRPTVRGTDSWQSRGRGTTVLQGTVLHEGKVAGVVGCAVCWDGGGVFLSLLYIYILVACWSVQAPSGVISAEAYDATLTTTL